MQALYRLKLVCSEVSESLYHKFEMDLNSALLFVSKLYESELCFFFCIGCIGAAVTTADCTLC